MLTFLFLVRSLADATEGYISTILFKKKFHLGKGGAEGGQAELLTSRTPRILPDYGGMNGGICFAQLLRKCV